MDKDTQVFDNWANTYDTDVRQSDWLHAKYDKALQLVSDKIKESADHNNKPVRVLDVGAGTGNLAQKLLPDDRIDYTPIEPSKEMRRVFKTKFPKMKVHNAKLPNLKSFWSEFDVVVSTYVVHHVNYEDVPEMVGNLAKSIDDHGAVMLVDVMFESESKKNECIDDLEKQGNTELTKEIKDEFFHYIDTLKREFEKLGFFVWTKRITYYVWFFQAVK
ncbi:MAG TPA: class I SAM-dependent methyltransferase [Caldisericia bacterium]|nr:class I SAM-dependent methyltransferase [Caldisericia bacterium]HPF48727.1 class I SAM-dependent methyltransferase [Caldisericia bacterium]HPI83613.1 class I SAM-dependent methyltransferase [Caldisericia bacterium]HPQ93182.1 class I SAM-dependent methyltransferase [Caldisericia bacterium]HRV74985.1 class I SAM-dependent methyltransferase [Caldisericia bacterium]